jgi:hypothetical protein
MRAMFLANFIKNAALTGSALMFLLIPGPGPLGPAGWGKRGFVR